MNMPRFAGRAASIRKHGRGVGLNLVSLMDIFTILVFFLLVNSSNVQQMPNSKSVKLPQSTSDRLPEETLLLLVNQEHILVQGQPVVRLAELEGGEEVLIEPLLKELQHHAERNGLMQVGAAPGEVTIMGDREIEYRLLKRIVATCSLANYSSVSLAVIRKAREKV
ncbi:MAG: biopolymer transporter ExbD [Chromatiales bacterium]|nr:biopolymer transporter ExbD [Chromatiales bacterium]